MKSNRMKPPFKCHGNKYQLSTWIIDHFPENYQSLYYIEPYCGAASVLLTKEKSKEEVLNDLDQGVVAILRTLRDDHKEFVTRLRKYKYCEETFNKALKKSHFTDDFDMAINEYILRTMSRSGSKETFAPPSKVSWKALTELLPPVAERLQGVYLMNKPAASILDVYNEPDAFAYIDPPCLVESRSTKKNKFDMTEDEHQELCDRLRAFKGKVMISGQPSKMYSAMYGDWRCELNTNKLDCLWLNY